MKKILISLSIVLALAIGGIYYLHAETGDQATLGWDYTNNKDTWRVDSSGNFLPGTDNNVDIGSATYEVKDIYSDGVIYCDSISLNGDAKTSWGSVVSPMTDAVGYVYPTDSGGVLRLYDAGYVSLGAGTEIDTYILYDGNADDWHIGLDDSTDDFVIGYGGTMGTDNRITITDDADNTIITIGDNTNAYDHYLVFDGNAVDYYLGYMDTFDMLIGGYGSTPDGNPAFGIENAATPRLVLWNGIDGYGEIDLDYGSADITDHTFVSDGGTVIIDGTITLTSLEVISNATDDTVRIASEDADTVLEIYSPLTDNGDATLLLTADADADAGDRMAIKHDGATNSMFFQSDTASADTLATILTLAKTGVITTTAAINVEIDDASNTTVTDVLNLQHFTSGTAGAGIGAGLTFDLENAAGTEEEHAYIDVVATTSTDAAEDTDIVFGQMTAGAVAETLRIVAASAADASDYLQFTANTTETNAATNVLVLKTSTGTAADGYGMSISFQPEDATGAEEKASIDIIQTTAARTTNNTDIVFSQDSAGTMRESLRLVALPAATTANYLQYTSHTAEENGIVDSVKLLLDSSGTGAANLGMGISIHLDDAGGVEEQASIDFQLNTATNGAEDCDIIFSQNTAGAIAETLKLVAASSATTSDYLKFTGNTTETDGVVDMLILSMATGTATNNIGIGISWQPEDATGAEEHASLDVVLTDATRATADADFVFTQDVNGTLEERVRFDADGGTIKLVGTLPNILIGDGGEEDTKIVFDGNAQDYHIGLDDAGGAEGDLFTIGKGSALGTTPALTIDSDLNVVAVVSFKTPVETLAATETLTANESMKLLVLSHATEFATTLPTVATSSGITFRFVVGAAPSGASYTVVTNGGENKIQGLAVVNGAAVPAVDEDTITFTDTAAAVGDWIELTSDGTNWYVSGQGVAATAIVFTATP